MFLLDTNVVSALIRDPFGTLGVRMETVDPKSLYVNLIILGELKYGLQKRGSATLAERVSGAVSRLTLLPMRTPVDEIFGEIRVALERVGTPIGMNDLWIAAHALAEGATLVTAKEREFARVPGLKVENWLRA
jgi:tRNA(fMet)-specific endonuclease VapC